MALISTTAFLAMVGILLSRPTKTLAEELKSDSYVIQFGNFNTTSGEKSSANFNVTDTVGQTGSGPYGQYGSSGYFIGGGFQYIYQIDEFRFTISRNAIDLGITTPGQHTTGSHTLSITTRGAGGYKVYAYELSPLQTAGGAASIPDTTCDAGTCDETTAQPWINQSIPGFGFNMSGDDIATDFVNGNYYRQFADNSLSEAMQIIMSSATIANQRQSTVTYKLGIAGDQAAGNYQTGVVYVAVPGY
jgi:hypothetical protein